MSTPRTTTRREFIATVAAAAGASALHAQTPAAAAWSSPVIDGHFHLRRDVAANIAHMDGCGVTKAVLLSRDGALEQVRAAKAQYPGRLVWAVSTDITAVDASAKLTQAVKDGAVGFGEMKFHVAADSPEFQRMYALAGELGVPIMIHFQEVDHFEGEGKWASGFKQFEAMLKKYPKTKFIGHADAFWANLDAKYANEAAYPTGPITRGGVTDKLLGDYANLYGDLSANSGNNGMSRDPAFTADFLKRHQGKLLFGSDCSCADGKGSGVAQANNPAASRMAGKCVARETLTLLQGAVTPEIFRKLVWQNAHQLYRLTS
jgi:predicted TIM-barrel fold metal-dependent hydrolase